MGQNWFKPLLRRRFTVALLLVLQVAVFLYLLLSGSRVSSAVSALCMTLSFFVILHVVSKNDKGSYKLIWAILILVFPLFGGILYVMCNYQVSMGRLAKEYSRIENKTKNFFELCGDGYEAAVAQMPEYKKHIDYLKCQAGFPVYKDSMAYYLSPGEKKLEKLVDELEKAEKYIFLEYFIIQEGKMWDTVLEVLKRKAKQGVKVRVIYDDMGCFMLLPDNYPAVLKSFGIDCVVFNKFRPFLSTVQNNRDHRKIVSIDGRVAFTGGVNLADEYINAIEKHGHWKDAAVMVKGKAAWSLTLIFLQMWELCTGAKEEVKEYMPFEWDTHTDGFVQPYADNPIDKEYVGENVYMQIINSAKKYLYICTPYLIIDDNMVDALCLAAKSGVDVRIVTPHIWDKRLVHMTTRSFYRELINAGVRVYEYTKGFMHSKIFVSDDSIATVGTVNLDFRSLYLHFECGVKLYGGGVIEDIKKDFVDTVSVSSEITSHNLKCGFFEGVLQNILRIFAPLM